MSPVLLIINVLALGFMLLILTIVTNKYKLLFISFMLIPLILYYATAYFAYGAATWGIKESIMLLLRGGFILEVVVAAIACYLISQQEQDK